MNAWRSGPSLNHRRSWMTAAVIDNVPMVIGGRTTLGALRRNGPMEWLVGEEWKVHSDIVEMSGPRAFATACIMKP